MSIDRQRHAAVRKLQEMGYRWEKGEWVPGVHEPVVQPPPQPQQPQPANFVSHPLFDAALAVNKMCASLNFDMHSPILGPVHAPAKIVLPPGGCHQNAGILHQAFTSFMASQQYVVTYGSGHAPGLRIMGVDFETL